MVDQLLNLWRSRPSPEDCQRCRAALDTYVSAQLAGEPVTTLFPETAVHLDQCLDCAQAYGLVYEMQWAEINQQWQEPSRIPAPDLSFLESGAETTAVSPAAILRQHMQTTVGRLQIRLSAALLPLYQPLPQAATLRLAEDNRYGAILFSLTPAHEPELNLSFTLMAYRDRLDPDLCLVEVIVEPPGVTWPDLGGRPVRLQYDETAIFQETDDWGTAVFPDVPVARLETVRIDFPL